MTRPTDDAAEVLRRIPDPETVRDWLAEAVRRAELLRRLIRVAERKARFIASERKGVPRA